MGRLLALPSGISLARKNTSGTKHSSFFPIVSDKEKKFYSVDAKMKASESRTLITINLTLCIILQFEWQLQSQSLSQQLS
jgi:hypothetical protein